jgi:hypothetical protein
MHLNGNVDNEILLTSEGVPSHEIRFMAQFYTGIRGEISKRLGSSSGALVAQIQRLPSFQGSRPLWE